MDHLDLVEMMLIDGFMKLPPDFVRFAKGIMGKNVSNEARKKKELMYALFSKRYEFINCVT